MNSRAVTAGAFVISAAVAAFFYFRAPLTPQDGPESTPESISISPEGSPAKAPAERPSPTASLQPLTNNPKVLLFDEIMRSRNDNDPRMDRELKELDEATKELFREKYGALELEKRNERGTIVFLLGRNLKTEKDFSFMCDVLREAPCLSLADCRGKPLNISGEDFHHEAAEDVTLAYPQAVALQMLAKVSGESASRALRCGQDSKVEAIAEKANELLRGRSN